MEKDGAFNIWYSAYIDRKRTDYCLVKKIVGDYNRQFINAESEVERRRKILDRNFDVTFFGKSSHAEKYCSKNTLAVLLYHGIGVKSCYYTDYNPRIDVRYVESKYRFDEIKKRNIDTELVVTGFAKLDPIFNNFSKDQILESISLDCSKPTILYAPTFYPSSIEVFGEKFAELTKDYNLIVKLHHFSWLLKRYRHQRELFIKLNERYEHINLLPIEFFNIVPLYKIADVLLTEGSSTVFEFLATGKPSIFTDFFHLRRKHRLFFKHFRKHRLDSGIMEYIDFAYHLNSPELLPSIIEKAISEKERFKQIISERKRMFIGDLDGKASERIVDDIKSRLKI